MARNITITFADGSTHVYQNAPDNVTPDMVQQRAEKEFGKQVSALDGGKSSQETSLLDNVKQGAGNLVAGAVRGAGSIGATLLTPIDAAARALGVQNGWIGRADRRQAMDEGLHSMGADPDSLLFGAGKIGAEIAGTAGAGGLVENGIRAAAPVARAVAPSVANALSQSSRASQLLEAIASGGFKTGAPAATNALSKMIDLGIRSGGGAVTGGLSSGLVDPEYAGTGAAIGAAMPPLALVAGKTGQYVGGLTKKGGERNAVNKIADAIGPNNITQAVGDIQTYYPKGAENIPVSSAGVTKLPELARLEQGSRLQSSPDWYDFDLKQGKAVADNVLKATSEADDLSARFAERAQNWADNWAKASNSVKPRVFAKRMGALYNDLQQAKASPDAVNGNVSAVLQEIEDTVMKFGQGFTPEHLQQLRAEFNGKVKPMAKTAMQSAPRDNPAIKSIISELDDILNTSTGGKWNNVRQGYAEDTAKVHASKAAQIVRNAFIEPSTGIVRKAADAAGDIPKITDAGLMRAIDAARLPDKSLALSGDAVQRLEATLDALRRQGIVQGVKRSASAGGGSDTIGNAISLGAMASGVGHTGNALLETILNGGRKIAMGKTDNALAHLLMTPDDLAIALQSYANRSPSVFAQIPYRAAPVLAVENQ